MTPTTVDELIRKWIQNASDDALAAKLSEVAEDQDRVFSPRDVENRTRLRARLREEIRNRHESYAQAEKELKEALREKRGLQHRE